MRFTLTRSLISPKDKSRQHDGLPAERYRRRKSMNSLAIEILEPRTLLAWIPGAILYDSQIDRYTVEAAIGQTIDINVRHNIVSFVTPSQLSEANSGVNASVGSAYKTDPRTVQGLDSFDLSAFAEASDDEGFAKFAIEIAGRQNSLRATYENSTRAKRTGTDAFGNPIYAVAVADAHFNSRVYVETDGIATIEVEHIVYGSDGISVELRPQGLRSADLPLSGRFRYHIAGPRKPVIELLAGTFNASGSSAIESRNLTASIEWKLIPFTPYLGLIDPDGQLVAQGESIEDVIATKTGTWTVLVSEGNDFDFDGISGSDATGAYEIDIKTTMPDISVDSSSAVSWRAIQAGGGVSIDYSIDGRDLLKPANVQLFWKSDTGVLTDAGSAETKKEVGNYTGETGIVLRATQISPPPSFDCDLVAVFDFDETIIELSETNNKSEVSGLFAVNLRTEVEKRGSVLTGNLLADAVKNEPYEILVTLENLSSVSLPSFDLIWDETRKVGERPPVPFPRSGSLPVNALRFGASTTLSTGIFVHNWEWIPNENPVFKLESLIEILKGSLADVMQDLGSRLTSLATYTGLLGEMADIVGVVFDVLTDVEGDNTYTYAFSSKNGPVLNSGINRDVKLQVPLVRAAAYVSYIGMSEAAGANLSAALLHLAVGGLPGLAFTAGPVAVHLNLALMGLVAAAGYYELAKDPPDPDYMTHVVLQSIDSLTSEFDLVGIDKEFVHTQLRIASLRTAELLARNKADGAELAGNVLWQANQLSDSAAFGMQAAMLESRLIALASLMYRDLSKVTPEEFTEIKRKLGQEGLPDNSRRVLTQLGLTDSQIQTIFAAIVDGAVSRHPSYEQQQTDLRASAAISTYLASSQLFHAAQLRSEVLREEVRPLAAADVEQLAAAQRQLNIQIKEGISVASLDRNIETYLNSVISLTASTNNIAALEEYLDFAVAASLQTQSLEARPKGLLAALDKWQSKGDASPAAATELKRLIGDLESNLTSSKPAAFAANLASLRAAIDRFRSNGLSVASADLLDDYLARFDVLNGVWERPWHNSNGSGAYVPRGLDVDTDGLVSPLDVLIVINYLNSGMNGGVPVGALAGGPYAAQGQPSYVDVDGDSYVTPLDALLVINWLNKTSAGEGENDAFSLTSDSSSIDYAAYGSPWFEDLVADLVKWRLRRCSP